MDVRTDDDRSAPQPPSSVLLPQCNLDVVLPQPSPRDGPLSDFAAPRRITRYNRVLHALTKQPVRNDFGLNMDKDFGRLKDLGPTYVYDRIVNGSPRTPRGRSVRQVGVLSQSPLAACVRGSAAALWPLLPCNSA